MRDYLDEPTASRWSDAELTRYINQGLHQVQSDIQSANGDYFLRVEVATAAAGAFELAFPADIWGNKLRAVYCYENSTVASGEPHKLSVAPLENVYGNLNVSGTPQGYAYHAGFIRWFPLLQSNSAFRFIYALKETAFASGTDVLLQIGDEHTDCSALYAAIMARGKIGAPINELSSMYTLRMKQIKGDVTPMDPITIPQVEI